MGQMTVKDEFVKPFDVISVDLCGPLPMTKNKNRFIIVIVDSCSKWVIAKPLKTATSETVIEVLRNNVILDKL